MSDGWTEDKEVGIEKVALLNLASSSLRIVAPGGNIRVDLDRPIVVLSSCHEEN